MCFKWSPRNRDLSYDRPDFLSAQSLGDMETSSFRSAAMEHLVRTEVKQLVADWEAGTLQLDGLIYMMGRRSGPRPGTGRTPVSGPNWDRPGWHFWSTC